MLFFALRLWVAGDGRELSSPAMLAYRMVSCMIMYRGTQIASSRTEMQMINVLVVQQGFSLVILGVDFCTQLPLLIVAN